MKGADAYLPPDAVTTTPLVFHKTSLAYDGVARGFPVDGSPFTLRKDGNSSKLIEG